MSHRLFSSIVTLSLFCFLFSPLPSLASDSSISGKVVDTNGDPIENVAIRIHQNGSGAVTLANGSFELPNVPTGKVSLEFSHLSYKTFEITVHVNPGIPLKLRTVTLEALILEGEELVYTASRNREYLKNVTVPVSVVNTSTLESRESRSSAEVLSEEPGLAVQKTSHGGGSAIIRGMDTNRILLLVDGVRMNNSTYRLGNHPYLATVDNQALDRIEVLRGPSSSVYGSDALGGVINLMTPQPFFTDSTILYRSRIYSRYGTADGETVARVSGAVSAKKFYLSAGGTIREFDHLRRGTTGSVEGLERSPLGTVQKPSGFKTNSQEVKLAFKDRNDGLLSLSYQKNLRRDVPRYDKYEINGYHRWLYDPQERELFIASGQTSAPLPLLFNRLTLDFQLSYGRQVEGRIKQKTPTSSTTVERDQVRTVGMQVQLKTRFKGHHLTLGSEQYDDAVDSYQWTKLLDQSRIKESRGRYPDDASYQLQGAWIRDKFALSKRLFISLDLQSTIVNTSFKNLPELVTEEYPDELKFDFSSITGGGGLLYKLTDSIGLRTSLRHGFRSPNLSELAKLGESKGNFFDVPNYDLQPEQIVSFDIGGSYKTEAVHLDMSLYKSWLRDAISTSFATWNGSTYFEEDGTTYFYTNKANVGNVEIYGVEAAGDIELFSYAKLFAVLNWTYGEKTDINEAADGIPPLNGLGGIRWQKTTWSVESFIRFADRQDRLSSDEYSDPRIIPGGNPGWYTLNLRSSVRFGQYMTLRAAFENILDRNYREHGSGINSPGRNVIISLGLTY